MTKLQSLRAQLSAANMKLAILKDVMRTLQQGSDLEAMRIFVRLRSGEIIEGLADTEIGHIGRYSSTIKVYTPVILTYCAVKEGLRKPMIQCSECTALLPHLAKLSFCIVAHMSNRMRSNTSTIKRRDTTLISLNGLILNTSLDHGPRIRATLIRTSRRMIPLPVILPLELRVCRQCFRASSCQGL